MTELSRRVAPYDLEVRGDGRTVCGIAVPFNDPTEIREGTDTYVEVFRPGAFRRTITQRGAQAIKILAQHDSRQRLPLGRAETLREDPTGLYIEARLSKTREADEVLELVKDGALDAFSIGFAPDQDREQRTDDGRRLVERLSVKLREVSLVTWGAFPNALVTAVRTDADRLITPAAARRRLAALSEIARNR